MTAPTPACSRPVGRLMASSVFSIPDRPVSQAERIARPMPPRSPNFNAKISFRVSNPSLINRPLLSGSLRLAVPWQEK